MRGEVQRLLADGVVDAEGVKTVMSCQDNQGCVWICFELVEYLRFLDLAKCRAPLLHRVLCYSNLNGTYLLLDLRFPKRYKKDFLVLLQVESAAEGQ
jgi:hypothetical protein